MIECACGCGFILFKKAGHGKSPKYYKNGHHCKGNKNASWKGGRKIGRYILILDKRHPFADSQGYVPEHRLIMERYLGRYLDPREIIHHINGDRFDNKIKNLQLLGSQSEHMILHKDYDIRLARIGQKKRS